MAPISTNLRYSIDDMEASVTYYDENGLPNEPVPVVRAPGRTEGEEGDDGPQAQPVAPWISNVSITHKGVQFEAAENETGFVRWADLTVFIENVEGDVFKSVLTVTQGSAVPVFKLDSEAETYEGYGQQCVVPAMTNNLVPYSDQVEYDVVYDVPVGEGDEWILKPEITDEGLAFSLTMNEGSAPRTATIKLSFTDASGASASALCKVTQKPYPAAADFATVRALTPGRDHDRAVYRRVRRQRSRQQEHRFESPDQTVLLRPRRERPDGLHRESRRAVRFLPEVCDRRRQYAGPFLEGAACNRRRPPSKRRPIPNAIPFRGSPQRTFWKRRFPTNSRFP